MSELLPEIPNPVVECAGCGDELSLLTPHLKLQIKAELQVLTIQPLPGEEGEITGNNYVLGSKSGRGRIFHVHDFECLTQYASERSDLKPKLELHAEDEIYVPEDNRSPEELVEAGELPSEILDLQAALSEGEQ
jgi:hypothetical protein